MSLQNQLHKYGLSEKEAQAYISLLKLGTATITQLAKDTNISRTTIYDVAKALRDRGIVSSSTQNKVLFLEAAPPEKLIHILTEKQNIIKDILPELKNLQTGIPVIPKTELFVGKEGVKTVYQTLLDTKKPLLAFSNTNAMLELLPYYAPRHIASRIKQKILLKVLSEDSKIAKEILFSKDKKELRQTRVCNELKDAEVTMYVTEGIVGILSTSQKEPLGIIIHHEEFAKMQEILFNKIWKQSKKIN
jgi:sugar-specific transcriptional regulator TrmB